MLLRDCTLIRQPIRRRIVPNKGVPLLDVVGGLSIAGEFGFFTFTQCFELLPGVCYTELSPDRFKDFWR
jgi:hypothetical protein